MRRNIVRVATLIVAAALLNGCLFRDLKNDLAEYERSVALVGKVIDPNQNYRNVIVVLFSETEGRQIPIRYVFPEDTGHFSFLVEPGTYYLRAFEDENENLDHDPGEYAGEYGHAIQISFSQTDTKGKPERSRYDLDIRLTPKTDFFDGLDMTDNLLIEQMPVFKLGTLATLEDPMFDQANGSIGYWKPLNFIKHFGIGIYFLEPYDPSRIPVLYVHGATGTPAAWKDLAGSLDQRRFQSWFYYYPSGIRLDVTARILQGLIQTLHQKYRFDTLYVTAHSMGGLVSRAAILANHRDPDHVDVKHFVALSTPWGGIRMAEKGAEKAPTAIPSWHDVATGSDFIQTIYAQSFPPEVAFHLFFSHRGNCSLFMENNDGTVELDSELDYRAQADADGIFGFNEDHGSILHSQETIQRYQQVLNSFH